MVVRNAVPLILTLLWRVPLSPPTPQYAGVALTQGRNPQAFPAPGGFVLAIAWRAFGRPRATHKQSVRCFCCMSALHPTAAPALSERRGS
jgi:hypothetical protein